jgi:hypothetical protein
MKPGLKIVAKDGLTGIPYAGKCSHCPHSNFTVDRDDPAAHLNLLKAFDEHKRLEHPRTAKCPRPERGTNYFLSL